MSDADTMFSYLAPKAKKPPHIALLTTPGYLSCKNAKGPLHDHGLVFIVMCTLREEASRIACGWALQVQSPARRLHHRCASTEN